MNSTRLNHLLTENEHKLSRPKDRNRWTKAYNNIQIVKKVTYWLGYHDVIFRTYILCHIDHDAIVVINNLEKVSRQSVGGSYWPLYSSSSAVLTSRLRNVSRWIRLVSSDCWRCEARNAWFNFISRCWINSTCFCSSTSCRCLSSSDRLDATSCSKRFSRSRSLFDKPFNSIVCTGVKPTTQSPKCTC